MLTTNLSTRPFYNERTARTLLALLLLLVIALTVFAATTAYSLRTRERALSASATQALAEADRLRAEARVMTAQINPKELEAVSRAATEANAVIAQRTFSWVALFEELEATLPDDVRVTAVQPRVEKGNTIVLLNVQAMSSEHLATFIEALERRGAFRQVLPHNESLGEDDVIDAVVEATYQPDARPLEGVRPASASSARGGRRE
jgi:Tfp pilus assembly protein PilN